MISFDDMTRTTRTVIADTNMVIDIDKLFEILPITECVEPVKRRGRKRKDNINVPIVLPNGSIVSAKYGDKYKGLQSSNGKSAFKNSITIIMEIKHRRVNFKLSKNGRFQITGNNDDYHVEKCVKYMWKIIKEYEDLYTINGTSLKVTFWSSMTNFKVNIGMRIDRQELNTYINKNTEYVSFFETSSGSASVNIKMPLIFQDKQLNTIVYRSNKWVKGTVSYTDFMKKTTGKALNTTNRFISFLVFHTGELIMTSTDKESMRPYFYKFMSIIEECKELLTPSC